MEKLAPTLNKLKELTGELAVEIRGPYNNTGSGLLEFFKMIFDCIEGSYVEIVTSDHKLLYVSPWSVEITKEVAGIKIKSDSNKSCFERIWNRSEPCPWCPMHKAIAERKVLHLTTNDMSFPIDKNIEYNLTVIPLVYNGVSGAILIASMRE